MPLTTDDCENNLNSSIAPMKGRRTPPSTKPQPSLKSKQSNELFIFQKLKVQLKRQAEHDLVGDNKKSIK